MSAKIQGPSNVNPVLVVNTGLSLAAKPSAVMAVMRRATPAARNLYRFDSTTVWYSNKLRVTMECMPD